MTLSVLERHSPIADLFKSDFSVGKILTDEAHCTVIMQ